MNDDDLRNTFTAFLEVVIRRIQIDYTRRKKVQAKRQAVLFLADVPEPSYEPDFLPSLSDEFDFAESRLAHTFSTLPLMQQQVLTLLFVDELSAEEIAERLHCTRDYVYTAKLRAAKRIRLRFEGGDQNEDQYSNPIIH